MMQANNLLVGSVSKSNLTLQTGSSIALPKSGQVVTVRPMNTVVDKVLLKAVSKSSKKDPKVFCIRYLDFHTTCKKLREAIQRQLPDDIIRGDFDIGVVRGNTVVSIRSERDILEVFNDLKCGVKITLWCDGLRDVNVS